MIIGIGTDIIEIDRVNQAVERNQRFLTRYFTQAEVELFKKRKNNKSTIAANFADKEAVSKCFGTGIRNFALKDIEVLRDDLGKPYVQLYNNALKLKEDMGIKNLLVTISHSNDNAVAFAVAEGVEKIEGC